MWIPKKCFLLLTVRASLTFVRYFFFASCSIMISEESRVHSSFFPHVLFFECSTFKCWWRFCPLKLSIRECKNSYTGVMPKVHFTCPVSDSDP